MYKIIGADGKEYGPVTADQVRQWITEGRADVRTLAQSAGATDWKPLSAFPELAGAVPPARPPVSPTAPQPLKTFASAVPPRTDSMATAGFICSLLGLICCGCGPLFSTLGLILSIVGIGQINKRPNELTGKGLAIAGIVLAILGLASFVIFLVSGLWSQLLHELKN